MKKKIMHDQSLSPYLKGYDLEDLDSVIKYLMECIIKMKKFHLENFSEKILKRY